MPLTPVRRYEVATTWIAGPIPTDTPDLYPTVVGTQYFCGMFKFNPDYKEWLNKWLARSLAWNASSQIKQVIAHIDRWPKDIMDEIETTTGVQGGRMAATSYEYHTSIYAPRIPTLTVSFPVTLDKQAHIVTVVVKRLPDAFLSHTTFPQENPSVPINPLT